MKVAIMDHVLTALDHYALTVEEATLRRGEFLMWPDPAAHIHLGVAVRRKEASRERLEKLLDLMFEADAGGLIKQERIP